HSQRGYMSAKMYGLMEYREASRSTIGDTTDIPESAWDVPKVALPDIAHVLDDDDQPRWHKLLTEMKQQQTQLPAPENKTEELATDTNEKKKKKSPPDWLRADEAQQQQEFDKHLETVVKQFRLNTEQRRALWCVGNTLFAELRAECDAGKYRRPPQMTMYIGGSGGTGKSTVIRAIQTLFVEVGHSEWLITSSAVGRAASLI